MKAKIGIIVLCLAIVGYVSNVFVVRQIEQDYEIHKQKRIIVLVSEAQRMLLDKRIMNSVEDKKYYEARLVVGWPGPKSYVITSMYVPFIVYASYGEMRGGFDADGHDEVVIGFFTSLYSKKIRSWIS